MQIKIVNTQKILLCLLLLLNGLITLAQEDKIIKIQYLSGNLVYLDAGRDAGLDEGDRVFVMEGDQVRTELKVVNISSKSAACTIISGGDKLAVGDQVKPAPRDRAASPVAAPTQTRKRDFQQTPTSTRTSRKDSGFSGSVSFQTYNYYDQSSAGQDFQRPGLRLNLKGRDLWNRGLDFRLRTKTRYIIRDNNGQSVLPENEWKNRIYQASLGYQNPEARFNWQVGRLVADKFGGVGYIDGGLGQVRLGKGSYVGIFAGLQPEWQNSDIETSLSKYGLYYNFRSGNFSSRYFESTIALAGEYHGGTVNRELVYLRNQFQGGRFSFFQSAEVDINRDWRKDASGDDFSITNLHIYGRYRMTDAVDMTLTYDDRKLYYTFELRNQDELYFDDQARSGYRVGLRWRGPNRISISGDYGIRQRDGQDDSTNYLINLYKNDLLMKGLSLNLRVNGFTNQFSEGVSPALRVGKRFGSSGHTLYLGYSTYDYTYLDRPDRHSEWIRLDGYFALTRSLYLSSQLEYTGDDAEGYRVFLELGVRF